MKKSLFLFFTTRILALFLMPVILSDTGYYVILAKKMFHGGIPYIDFPFEYPPLAILPIYLPGIIGPESYRFWFMSLALIFDFMVFWEITKKSSHSFFYVVLSALCLPFLLERLDIFMIFPMIMAISCYQNKKFNQGLIWSTIGGWFKLIPFITYIGTFNYKNNFWRTQVKIILLNFVLLTLFSMLFYSNMFDFLKYHTDRPFQVESVVSSFVLVSAPLLGFKYEIVNSFGSQNVIFPGMEIFLKLTSFLIFVSFGWLIYFYNKHKAHINLYDATSLFIFFLLIFSKVLSDQFFIWPLAFLFLGCLVKSMNRFDKAALTLIYLITCILFINYWSVVEKSGGIWHWFLFLKNILLVYIAAKSIFIIRKQTRTALGDHSRL